MTLTTIEKDTITRTAGLRAGKNPKQAEEVLYAVASDFGLDVNDIVGRTRRAVVTTARDTVALLLHGRGWDDQEVATFLGRERSSVSSMRKRARARLAE